MKDMKREICFDLRTEGEEFGAILETPDL